MKKGISVIICTYNGITKLAETLNHLAAQIIPQKIACEIIVVDNASTDGTATFVLTEWNKYSLQKMPLSVITETTPGKLFALKSGIAYAKYEYFILCDDDNWLNPDYISIAFNILEDNPKIGAAGGQGIGVTENGISFPSWFEVDQNAYAVGKQAPDTGDITSRRHLWGAGLISRTALYLETYQEFPSLLLTGNNKKTLSTEDTEYCLRIILKGYRLYYDSRLIFQHFISKDRLTLQYKNALYENFKEAHLILEKYYLAIKLSKENLSLLNKVRLILITPFRLVFKKNKEKEKTILYYLFPTLVHPDPLTVQIRKHLTLETQ